MQVEPRIDQRIFVVGVPRSGTTLVQSLLAAHSTITSFTESHFFSRHFTHLLGLSTAILTRNPAPRLGEFLAENDEQPTRAAGWFEDSRLLTKRPFLPIRTWPVARHFLQVLDELTLRRSKMVWVEKTPRHLRYIPLIERVSRDAPRTSFVHVIRDGLETVASLHQASQSWERPYDLESCARRWNEDVRISLARTRTSNNRRIPTDHYVCYERLTAQPEETLQRLLAELGLSWEPDILEHYAGTSDQLITQEEAWKKNVGRGIHRSGTSDRVLTAQQRDLVKQLLHQNLYDQLLERDA